MVFLDVNGWELGATPEDVADLILGVAAEALPKSAIAEFLRRRSRPA